MDLRKEAEKLKTDLSSDSLADITSECNKLMTLHHEIKKIEERLKELQSQERNLSQEVIPNLLHEVGVSEIKTIDGATVQVKPFIKASITKANQEKAFAWLRDNGFEDIIKNQLAINFKKSEDNMASDIFEDLKSKGLNVNREEKVNTNTLTATFRELILEKGEAVPSDVFSIYQSSKTKIIRS